MLLKTYSDLVTEVLNQIGANYGVWLGGTDEQQENTWMWTDGSPGINCNCIW